MERRDDYYPFTRKPADPSEAAQARAAEIQADIERFKSEGGKVQEVAPGVTADTVDKDTRGERLGGGIDIRKGHHTTAVEMFRQND